MAGRSFTTSLSFSCYLPGAPDELRTLAEKEKACVNKIEVLKEEIRAIREAAVVHLEDFSPKAIRFARMEEEKALKLVEDMKNEVSGMFKKSDLMLNAENPTLND